MLDPSYWPPGGARGCGGLPGVVTCACGMRWQGTIAELIPQVRRHGLEIHNMDATDEQVIAMSVDADAAAPWYIEVGADGDPVAVVASTVRRVLGEPSVLHSTSWRRDRAAVILSFVAVVEPSQVAALETVPIVRSELARGGATRPPDEIKAAHVVEHGLRHLAWPRTTRPSRRGWPVRGSACSANTTRNRSGIWPGQPVRLSPVHGRSGRSRSARHVHDGTRRVTHRTFA